MREATSALVGLWLTVAAVGDGTFAVPFDGVVVRWRLRGGGGATGVTVRAANASGNETAARLTLRPRAR